MILFVCCSHIHASGQATNIKFKHLSIKEGLSQSTINAITQDEMGFMWFGTQDGLNKYDGYDFITYKQVIDDSTTISSGFINSFYNDNKGHLWVGTNSGISIFHHNSNSFVSISEMYPALLGLKEKTIRKIRPSFDSSIYIISQNELYRYQPQKGLEKLNVDVLNQVDQNTLDFTDVLQVDENTLFLASSGQGICVLDLKTSKWSRITSEGSGSFTSINSDNVHQLFRAKNGEVYIASDFGINIYDPKNKQIRSHIYNVNDPFAISTNYVTSITEDHLGNIWLGTKGGGLNKFDRVKSEFFSYKKNVNNESSIISNDITSIYQDNSGIMWIGTSVGLSKFDILKQNFNHFDFDLGGISSISRNIIWSIYAEEEILWVGSNEGLNKFNRQSNVNETYTPSIVVNNERRANAIYSVLRLNAKEMLLGTDGGVYLFNSANNSFRVYNAMGVRIKERTYNIIKDSKDRIWVASRSGLHLFDRGKGVYKNFNQRNGLPSNIARKIIESRDKTIWVGTDDGLCKVIENGEYSFEIHRYEKGNPNTLRNNTVLSLIEDEDGFIWIGTFGGGLSRLDPKNKQVISFTERDGLANNVIYGMLLDEKENLWCSTNNGLSKFNIVDKSVDNYDEYDGLQSNEFNVGAYFQDDNGELFFGGIKGVNSFFPSNIKVNNLPPHLVITDFQLFNKSVQPGPESVLKESISVTDQIELSYTQNVFSFSFSALHYSLPERNRYAYKLEGFDQNWTFDDNTRRAKYTNLDPGKYTFMVKGTNSDNKWSEVVELEIVIRPPFWRIWWIQVISILFLAGGAFLFYRNRLRTIQAQKERLEKEVEQRTIEVRDQKEEIEKQKLLLEEEKEKLETLLLNVLPESTVEELKVKGKATARNYNKVSVMFTDFKGFTKISESLKPTELVSKLDSFFVKFDEIIEKYNVEKIKTIGDAYMCAGGIPIRNKSNPIDVVLAGLEVQRVMDDFNEELKKAGEPEWGLRLGIHTGVIIAGVIGIKRFAYDIWGDTVNVASRVETNGEVGMVNVSEATYEEIKDYFHCEYRGKIHAKNKGEIDMYFVHSIKPHLSVDGNGIEPNDTFWEYVNLNLFSPIKYHEAEQNILKKLEKSLPKDLHYHNVQHTIEVCQAVERIALREGIHNEDLFALKMAALYHDAGFIEKYQNNETLGAKMAREDLPNYGFNEDQIELIENLILVTFATKRPKTMLEKILRDADLDYLGREDFHDVSAKLKQELLDRNMVRSDEHWDELQVTFLENHQYYTSSAKEHRNEMKMQHLQEIKDRIKKKNKNEVAN